MKELFWNIIDDAKCQSGRDLDAMYEYLFQKLEALELSELMIWAKLLEKYYLVADHKALRCAAEIINGGAAGQEDYLSFYCWLIAQGRDAFYAVAHNPACLTDEKVIRIDFPETIFGELASLPVHVFLKKQNIDHWDYAAYEEEYNKYSLSEETLRELDKEMLMMREADLAYLSSNLERKFA